MCIGADGAIAAKKVSKVLELLQGNNSRLAMRNHSTNSFK
jgi:hypothetical protein